MSLFLLGLFLISSLLCLLSNGQFASKCEKGSYYSSVASVINNNQVVGESLQNALHDLIDGHNALPYTSSNTDTWDALKVIDENPSNPSQVCLIYTGTCVSKSSSGANNGWNREHVWPKSYGVYTSGPDTTDIHNLYPSDSNVNSARGNLYFDDCPASGCRDTPAHKEAAGDTGKNSVMFQPPKSKRGNLARAIFYMATRYDGSDSGTENLVLSDCPCSSKFTFGVLSTLLKWHAEDPVDALERSRNNKICSQFQGNRNPFVDYPELVGRIWRSGSCHCGPGDSNDGPIGGINPTLPPQTSGTIRPSVPPTPPPTPEQVFTCDDRFYDNSDGCDCECGKIDPDCTRNYQELYCNGQRSSGTCNLETNTCVSARPYDGLQPDPRSSTAAAQNNLVLPVSISVSCAFVFVIAGVIVYKKRRQNKATIPFNIEEGVVATNPSFKV